MKRPPPGTAESPGETDRRGLARERLYVLCQVGGWSFFLITQLIFIRIFSSPEKAVNQGPIVALVQGVCLGLLITHLARGWITRSGWKQLGWKPLVPRVVGLAAVLSLGWVVSAYAIYYGLLRYEWPEKFHWSALVFTSFTQGMVLMIGWLCLYFFYHLFDRFNRLDIERLQLAATVKDAELRALKAQVNPHFIFNSLNSVRALIDEDPSRARQAVTQLASLLRYSLKSGQLETVPFEEELSVVNDYLALEQVRHEERLRLRLDIDPAAMALPVPPMLLQTLVENAVKYGVASRPEGGEVRVVARLRPGCLQILVTNPGTLSAAAASALRTGSTGVGLDNANQRLRLLFGEKASLELRQTTPDEVEAEMVIPVDRSRAEPAPGGRRPGIRAAARVG